MISFRDLIPRPSLKGADISGMPSNKNLRWLNLSGAKCDYYKLKNPTWIQKGLVIYCGDLLRYALIAEQYGDSAIRRAHLDGKYYARTTVLTCYSHLNSDKYHKYAVTIQRKSCHKKSKDTRPSLAGVDISETDPSVDLSAYNLNGAICKVGKLKNPSWVQEGLIIDRGLIGAKHDAMEVAIKHFERSGVGAIAKPRCSQLDDWTYSITVELLDKESKDEKDD